MGFNISFCIYKIKRDFFKRLASNQMPPNEMYIDRMVPGIKKKKLGVDYLGRGFAPPPPKKKN